MKQKTKYDPDYKDFKIGDKIVQIVSTKDSKELKRLGAPDIIVYDNVIFEVKFAHEGLIWAGYRNEYNILIGLRSALPNFVLYEMGWRKVIDK